MADGDAIVYNVAVFISALFLLEFGADKFVDHTAIVARRTGISDTVIALLTAGAEWEEVRLPIHLLLFTVLIKWTVACCRHCFSSAGSTVTSSRKYHRFSHLEYPRRLFSRASVPSCGLAR